MSRSATQSSPLAKSGYLLALRRVAEFIRSSVQQEWLAVRDFWTPLLMPKLAERRRLDRLARWLIANPIIAAKDAAPARTVSYESVIRWDRWPTTTPTFRRSMAGWWCLNEAGHCSGSWPHVLTPLAKSSVVEWEGAFADIDGLSGSKSPLEAFTDLDDFARACCSKWILPATEEQLLWCLNHKPLHDWRLNGAMMVRADWDQRTFLLNSDGSHHFAAARYLSKALEIPVYIGGKMKTWALCRATLDRLNMQYALFCLGEDSFPRWRAFALLAQISFGLLEPPRPLEGFFVLAIERISKHHCLIELLETQGLCRFDPLLHSLARSEARATGA